VQWIQQLKKRSSCSHKDHERAVEAHSPFFFPAKLISPDVLTY
jgi:hypothetical protein